MEITPDSLKILATIISIIASVILAWRVRNILSALALVAGCHEVNIQQLLPNHQGDQTFLNNSNQHVEKAKGMKLLVTGFALYGLAGVLNLIALIMIN